MALTFMAIQAGSGTHTQHPPPHMAIELRASDTLWDARHSGSGACFFRHSLARFLGWAMQAAGCQWLGQPWRMCGDLNFSGTAACP